MEARATSLAVSLQVTSLRVMETRATSLCRSAQVALRCLSQRPHVVAPGSRSRQCSSKDHSNHLP
ncbi:hypothetical protein F2Q69_00037839 [Brassica cretica]|uniref:Uncharacterized protein n=1 Tax=Brassica cretica TaxID=69181 RepID=A0A8S9SHV4_BRACR|nr:hypothetical protein F2Q69_00037839 [Brassica cretica]